jgi:hypothetical protein
MLLYHRFSGWRVPTGKLTGDRRVPAALFSAQETDWQIDTSQLHRVCSVQAWQRPGSSSPSKLTANA